ncbi:MAG: 1,4-alpha-glucan branching protein domain-containing protein [Acidimicrobiia bacterium]
MSTARGSFMLVLHTHMPFLKKAGRWPVGEEWLFQAWGEAYLPVLDVLDRQAGSGRRGVATLGLTPLVVRQMEDPGLLERFHAWLGHSMLRAEMLAANAGETGDRERRREAASTWWSHHRAVLEGFERRGCELVPSLRRLVETGTIEVLGGPATHPYLPLHDATTVHAQVCLGLDEAERTFGVRPGGIWLPECAYRPGLEDVLETCGVTHLLLDGPTILQAGGFPAIRRAWTLGGSRVCALGRDLEVSYRVWSPTGGYPGDGAYREYHRWEWETGMKLWRVTDKAVPQADKEWYDPALVVAATESQVDDFTRLLRQSVHADGDAVVACYDTELFGHWWLEGPRWLELLLDRVHADDVLDATTPAAYLERVGPEGALSPPAGSWGLRKDFSIWDNDATAHIWKELTELDGRFRDALRDRGRAVATSVPGRLLAQACRELYLAQCSDWPFMIGHDKSVDYARERFGVHAEACARCLDALAGSGTEPAAEPGWLAGLEADHDVLPCLTPSELVDLYAG